MKKLRVQDIEKMNYNEIISLVKETNRPPGGRDTIQELINKGFIRSKCKILEIGTSTGFTPLEILRFLDCSITSIDINENSLEEARKRALQEGLGSINFLRADVNNLPFKEGEFDVVIIGNVLSLMNNKEKAFEECRRACKKNGFIISIPMYYLKTPPEKTIKEVSKAIGVNITPLYKLDWDNFFKIDNLEVYFEKNYYFEYQSDEILEEFIEIILKREHLNLLDKSVLTELGKKYKRYMFLFRDNLSLMGYSIIVLVNKRVWEDPELFIGKEIK